MQTDVLAHCDTRANSALPDLASVTPTAFRARRQLYTLAYYARNARADRQRMESYISHNEHKQTLFVNLLFPLAFSFQLCLLQRVDMSRESG